MKTILTTVENREWNDWEIMVEGDYIEDIKTLGLLSVTDTEYGLHIECENEKNWSKKLGAILKLLNKKRACLENTINIVNGRQWIFK